MTIWSEKNNRTFNRVELSIMEMKALILRSLFERSRTYGVTDARSVDFIDSFSFRM